jgi:hypothetical protein
MAYAKFITCPLWCTVEVREEHRLERSHRQQQRPQQVGDREGDPGEDEDARGIPVPRQEEGADQAIITFINPILRLKLDESCAFTSGVAA